MVTWYGICLYLASRNIRSSDLWEQRLDWDSVITSLGMAHIGLCESIRSRSLVSQDIFYHFSASSPWDPGSSRLLSNLPANSSMRLGRFCDAKWYKNGSRRECVDKVSHVYDFDSPECQACQAAVSLDTTSRRCRVLFYSILIFDRHLPWRCCGICLKGLGVVLPQDP